MNYFFSHRAVICAALGCLVGLIRYTTYIRSILRADTHPHVFSWLNWCIMIGIGAWAQYKLGGGPSVAVLVMVSFVCAFITLLSLRYGEKNITRTETGWPLSARLWPSRYGRRRIILSTPFSSSFSSTA